MGYKPSSSQRLTPPSSQTPATKAGFILPFWVIIEEMDDKFVIKVKEFEGPLDLLLQLIEKNKLHISEISLGKVADEYLGYLENKENIAKKDMADFLMIGSTLMLIKSISLLPTIERTEEESASIEDLERRLKMYQRFQELSQHIKNNYNQKRIYFRSEKKQIEVIFTPTKDITIERLKEGIKSVLLSLPKIEKVPEVIIKKVITLETAMQRLTKRIQSNLKLSFNEFVGSDKKDKVNVIVSFLGLLELVHQGIMEVKQEKLFTDINMESTDPGTPRYDTP